MYFLLWTNDFLVEMYTSEREEIAEIDWDNEDDESIIAHWINGWN